MNNSKGRLTGLMVAILMVFPGIAAADGHWLFGAAIGTANIDESVDGFRFDADSTTYRLYGGYQFNDYFALEAGYLDLGSFDEQAVQGGNVIPVSADADGFTFAARASIPVSEKFALHGTVGWFFWDGANEIAGVNDNVSDANIFFGAGVGYSLTGNVSLRGDAAYYELDNVNSTVYTIGFQVTFQ
jgi:OOP family OmpA-OmpF porin